MTYIVLFRWYSQETTSQFTHTSTVTAISVWSPVLSVYIPVIYPGSFCLQVIFTGDNIPVHPHIYSNGHICLSILTEDWSPVLSVYIPVIYPGSFCSQVIFTGDNIPVHPHVYSNGHICLSILTEDWSLALSVYIPVIYPGSFCLQVIFTGDNIPVHPHVYSNGHICLSILTEDWSPALSVQSVCLSIVSMLSSCKEKVCESFFSRFILNFIIRKLQFEQNPLKSSWTLIGFDFQFVL